MQELTTQLRESQKEADRDLWEQVCVLLTIRLDHVHTQKSDAASDVCNSKTLANKIL